MPIYFEYIKFSLSIYFEFDNVITFRNLIPDLMSTTYLVFYFFYQQLN
jgi:hypothetical protein